MRIDDLIAVLQKQSEFYTNVCIEFPEPWDIKAMTLESMSDLSQLAIEFHVDDEIENNPYDCLSLKISIQDKQIKQSDCY